MRLPARVPKIEVVKVAGTRWEEGVEVSRSVGARKRKPWRLPPSISKE